MSLTVGESESADPISRSADASCEKGDYHCSTADASGEKSDDSLCTTGQGCITGTAGTPVDACLQSCSYTGSEAGTVLWPTDAELFSTNTVLCTTDAELFSANTDLCTTDAEQFST